jgi:CHAT domain-containing protein
VITVSAAMQHAGWCQVVATVWSVSDQAAYSVAGKVYAAVLQDGVLELDGIAKALHRVVRDRRDAHPDQPSLWAPFVHLGE